MQEISNFLSRGVDDPYGMQELANQDLMLK